MEVAGTSSTYSRTVNRVCDQIGVELLNGSVHLGGFDTEVWINPIAGMNCLTIWALGRSRATRRARVAQNGGFLAFATPKRVLVAGRGFRPAREQHRRGNRP